MKKLIIIFSLIFLAIPYSFSFFSDDNSPEINCIKLVKNNVEHYASRDEMKSPNLM